MSERVGMPLIDRGLRNVCIDPILIPVWHDAGNSPFPRQQAVASQQALYGLRKGDGLAQALVKGLERGALLLRGLPPPSECLAWGAAMW